MIAETGDPIPHTGSTWSACDGAAPPYSRFVRTEHGSRSCITTDDTAAAVRSGAMRSPSVEVTA